MLPIHQFFFEPFRLDPGNACLRRETQAIALTPRAFAVLQYLITHPGQLVTKDALLQAVWPKTAVSNSALKTCIREIRRALGDLAHAPRFIVTVHRRGYRFIAPVSTTHPSAAVPVEGALWRPRHHTSLRSHPSSVSRPPLLVGREVELACLHAWFEQARCGTRQVVLVSGEAGIGKTAVVEAFLNQIGTEAPLWVARGQCIEHYGPDEAYMPVLEALGRLCRAPGDERLMALLRQQAPMWLAQMPWLLSTANREGLQRELLGTTRERMLRELAEAIETLTAETPLVLVLEDLHWSDYATLDLVAVLARRREPARLLLLGTYRSTVVTLTRIIHKIAVSSCKSLF